MQDAQVHHPLALHSASSTSQVALEGLGEPRQDAPQGDSEAGVQTIRGQIQHPDLGEAIIAMPEDDNVGEPTSPKSELSSAPALAAFPLTLHDTQSNEKLMLADAQGQDSLSPSDSQVVAVGPSSNPAELAIEVAPTGLAQRLLDDMEHMERAKAKATSQAKQEAKAKAKALAEKAKAHVGNTKPKAKGKASATAKAKGKASAAAKAKGKANAKAQAIGEPSLIEGTAKAKAKASGGKRLQIDHELSRKTIRARIPNGPSKGFRYTCVADMERARKEAEEYIRANS